MDTKELISKIRKIEIKTRRIVDEITGGAYHSIFKGSGIEFNEVREYVPGDDVRSIDWNVTARSQKPFIKKYVEERELTVMLLVDISASGNFGSQDKTKREVAIETAALLAFSAIRNNDKVGLLLFSDEIELFMPPKSGRSYGLRLIRELVSTQPKGQGTNIKLALEHLMGILHKKSVLFLVSDFMDNQDFEKSLKIANRRHDLISVRILDELEHSFPRTGNLVVEDSENGILSLFRGRNKKTLTKFTNLSEQFHKQNEEICRRAKIAMIDIRTNEDIIKPFMKFFKKRGR